ncbi:MAG: hypothetical protein B7X36_07110 [Thiomonas sp. 14-64-326]|nr:MAG: hypothetical protein B7X36_07110 [Thiomonas sp. 14-64-326]
MRASAQAAARGDLAQVSLLMLLLMLLETKWVLRGGDKVGWPEGIGLFKKLLECADLLIENEDGWIAAGATPS